MTKSQFSKLLKVVGEEIRMQILCLLLKHEVLCVSEVASKLKVSIALASHHLKILEGADVVCKEKLGKESCYSLTKSKVVEDLSRLICNHAK
jgi:DNA-binding transcriptional ArsR family regulator